MANYNSQEVSVSMGGVPLSGFGEGTFVNIEFDSDATTDKVGTDSEVTASKTHDYRGTATITLMQSSSSNAVLAGFYQARSRGKGAIGVVPFFVEDANSGETFVADRAWIQKPPTVVFGNEAEGREWTIRFARGIYGHAGLSSD